MRILLIEDEAFLGDAVATHFNKLHAVDWMRSLGEASAAMQVIAYDLLLLDLNLPDGRGLDFLRFLRKAGQIIPVIIITARDQIRDRIEGLNAGADDYVLKPFDLNELTARVHSVQRRASGLPSPRFKIGPIEIDQTDRMVWRNDEEIHLTAREWALLECFVRRLGAIVTKAKLEEALYAFGSEIESNAVEVYVSRLRKKLGREVIRTVRGLGYRMMT